MPNPKESAVEAERLLVEFVQKVGCKNSDDVASVLELLISKSARAIEKYCGNGAAVAVCNKTASYVEANPAQLTKH